MLACEAQRGDNLLRWGFKSKIQDESYLSNVAVNIVAQRHRAPDRVLTSSVSSTCSRLRIPPSNQVGENLPRFSHKPTEEEVGGEHQQTLISQDIQVSLVFEKNDNWPGRSTVHYTSRESGDSRH